MKNNSRTELCQGNGGRCVLFHDHSLASTVEKSPSHSLTADCQLSKSPRAARVRSPFPKHFKYQIKQLH